MLPRLAVGAVDHVERIDDADHREDRQSDGPAAEIQHLVADQMPEILQHHVRPEAGAEPGGDLRHETPAGRQFVQVVKDADNHQQHGTREQRPQTRQ